MANNELMADPNQITKLLRGASAGDEQAASELLPLVYEDLRAVAQARLRELPPGQTLQATALVHEAYLRVARHGAAVSFADRRHFFFAAARAMRDILVESARKKSTLKRGGGRRRVFAGCNGCCNLRYVGPRKFGLKGLED